MFASVTSGADGPVRFPGGHEDTGFVYLIGASNAMTLTATLQPVTGCSAGAVARNWTASGCKLTYGTGSGEPFIASWQSSAGSINVDNYVVSVAIVTAGPTYTPVAGCSSETTSVGNTGIIMSTSGSCSFVPVAGADYVLAIKDIGAGGVSWTVSNALLLMHQL